MSFSLDKNKIILELYHYFDLVLIIIKIEIVFHYLEQFLMKKIINIYLMDQIIIQLKLKQMKSLLLVVFVFIWK